MMVRGSGLGGVVALGLALLSASCGQRAQLLVVIDTDAPSGGQLFQDPTISPEAVVDTVRFDRFDDDWKPLCIDDVDCTANYVLSDPSLWPLSFGVATPEAGSTTLRLRVRAFRAAVATPGKDAIGDRTFATINPPPEATIDRLIEVALPAAGEVNVHVLLSADCLGVPVSFRKPVSTCIDASVRSAAPSTAIDVGKDPGVLHIGTWPRAREVPCSAPTPAVDAVCIPGGFSFIGDAALANVDEQGYTEAAPPRPVFVDSFFMDRTELTVGRLRDLVSKGLTLPPGEPSVPDPTRELLADCRWLGPSNGANDAYPVNCLSWTVARDACRMSGGDLPTEAQWEHAARGRGQARIYPWGDDSPECCTASAGRGTLCPALPGPEKVGSHPLSTACADRGDVSRDGVLDLGGNLTEFCADKLIAYAAGCWSTVGVFLDPRCDDASVDQHAARGGDWNSGPANTRSTFRKGDQKSSLQGFRCVYPGAAK